MSGIKQDVIVIGAGVIGVSCGLALQKLGLNVTILDRESVAAEASQGNAGAFAFSEIIPLAQPGVILKAPKWMLDPMGPLSLPPSYAFKIMPWMLRFWRASWVDRFEVSTKAQASLMNFCASQMNAHFKNVRAAHMLRHEGQLAVYESKRQWEASKPSWNVWERYGIEFEHLIGSDEISKIQPGISSDFTHATYTPLWCNISDPKVYTHHLARLFVERGGNIEFENVVSLQKIDNGISVETSGGLHKVNKVVVAAGAWSHVLARFMGDKIPLETERGYNTTLPAGAFDLKTHLTFSEHGFVVSKIGEGIRVGGAVEFAGLKRAPNYRRAEIMLEKAKRFLPELDNRGGKQWMGFRPSMPDSLPVISYANRSKDVVYAFGHGHLGLTQSVGTACLVAELISNSKVSVDITPFRADRF